MMLILHIKELDIDDDDDSDKDDDFSRLLKAHSLLGYKCYLKVYRMLFM